jgi:hypothetical protein
VKVCPLDGCRKTEGKNTGQPNLLLCVDSCANCARKSYTHLSVYGMCPPAKLVHLLSMATATRSIN